MKQLKSRARLSTRHLRIHSPDLYPSKTTLWKSILRLCGSTLGPKLLIPYYDVCFFAGLGNIKSNKII